MGGWGSSEMVVLLLREGRWERERRGCEVRGERGDRDEGREGGIGGAMDEASPPRPHQQQMRLQSSSMSIA